MSIRAVSWALSSHVDRSSTKFVLVALCNYANEFGECYPSAKQLSEDTAQDIKTVEANLKRLRDMGFLVDTGARRGSTKQIIVYRINPEGEPVAYDETHPKTDGLKAETPPKTDALNTPVFPDNTPVFPGKDPRFSRQRPPKTGDGTVSEPSKEPLVKESAYAPPLPPDLLADYLAVRKAKKAGPLTKTAVSGICREAERAGISLIDAVTACCEYGWQGFNAAWYAERQAKTAAKQPAETFAERDARNARTRWEEITGRTHPDNLPKNARNVIDAQMLEIAHD